MGKIGSVMCMKLASEIDFRSKLLQKMHGATIIYLDADPLETENEIPCFCMIVRLEDINGTKYTFSTTQKNLLRIFFRLTTSSEDYVNARLDGGSEESLVCILAGQSDEVIPNFANTIVSMLMTES